jgi:hypothetical protein
MADAMVVEGMAVVVEGVVAVVLVVDSTPLMDLLLSLVVVVIGNGSNSRACLILIVRCLRDVEGGKPMLKAGRDDAMVWTGIKVS